MRFFSLLLFVVTAYSNSDINASECTNLLKELADTQENTKQLLTLKERNLAFYEKFKDDFSKKTKIFSNIMIINNKLETLKLLENSTNEKITQTGCSK